MTNIKIFSFVIQSILRGRKRNDLNCRNDSKNNFKSKNRLKSIIKGAFCWIVDFRFPWMAFLGDVRLRQNFPWKHKIHGKSVSTSVFLGVWFFVIFFLECGFLFHGKIKIHGKEIHRKIPRI